MDSQGYESYVAANTLIEVSVSDKNPLSNLHIHKLLYMVHGHMLALKGRPLCSEGFKAWNYGPVLPKLYKKLQKYQRNLINDYIFPKDAAWKPEEHKIKDIEALVFIRFVYDAYKKYSLSQLVDITHKSGSAWDTSYKNENNYQISIPNDLIKKDFLNMKLSIEF